MTESMKIFRDAVLSMALTLVLSLDLGSCSRSVPGLGHDDIGCIIGGYFTDKRGIPLLKGSRKSSPVMHLK